MTGGGQLAPDTTLGLTAKSDANGVKGGCRVIDRTLGATVKCVDVTSFVESVNHVTFSGNALVNGASTSYRIDVTDNADPGTGVDSFAIHAGAYNAGGTLTQGSIQIHG